MRKREREVKTRQGRLRYQPGYPKGFDLPFKEFEVVRRRWRTTRVERGDVVKEWEWAKRLREGLKCLEGISRDFEGYQRVSKGLEGYRRPSRGLEGLRGVCG